MVGAEVPAPGPLSHAGTLCRTGGPRHPLGFWEMKVGLAPRKGAWFKGQADPIHEVCADLHCKPTGRYPRADISPKHPAVQEIRMLLTA